MAVLAEGGAVWRCATRSWAGHEAKTIEAEEQGGFYRFERPRIYGRN